MKKYLFYMIVLLIVILVNLISYDQSTLYNKQIEREIRLFRKYVVENNIDKVSEYFEFSIIDEDIITFVQIGSSKSKVIDKIEKKNLIDTFL